VADTDDNSTLMLSSQHESFMAGVETRQSGNQLYVVLELLKQLQLTVPDKATAQATFNLIAQILPALANVASKQDLDSISARMGAIENAIGRVSQISILNDRDVQQLKEGQTAIKESVKTEAGRLEKAGENTGSDVRDLRKSIEALATEMGKVRAENKGWLLATVITIVLFVITVSTFFYRPVPAQFQPNQPVAAQPAAQTANPTTKSGSGP